MSLKYEPSSEPLHISATEPTDQPQDESSCRKVCANQLLLSNLVSANKSNTRNIRTSRLSIKNSLSANTSNTRKGQTSAGGAAPHLTPYTLHPLPHALYPTPYTLHPTP